MSPSCPGFGLAVAGSLEQLKGSKAGRKGSRKKIDIAKTSKQKAGITKSPDKLAAAGDITRDIYPFNTA